MRRLHTASIPRGKNLAPARRVAYQILLQIETTDAHSDELLRSAEVDALAKVDRHLTTTLVLGTLRWQLALEARIGERLARPEAKLSAEAATALRMGAYQLLYLDRVPAHAVVHDSVELVKQGKERGAAGMVNAVLRKLQGTGNREQGTGRPGVGALGTGKAAGGSRSAAEIAAAFAHPVWMVERWVRRYGAERAEAICRWDQEAAGTAVRGDPGAGLDELETEPGAFLSCARRVVGGDVGAAVRAGRVRVQDEASQLVAEMAAAGAGGAGKVLDLCAAPGGKTAILAERMPQAEITAADVSRKRVLAAQSGRFAASAQPNVRWEVADATQMELKPEWDLILCDAPCSGTGTMARNPEIRLRVREADLRRQQARQAAIVRAGLRGLKPGGRLVYSTCSLEPEENEEVVAEVLGGVAGLEVVAVAGILDGLAGQGVVTAEGRERLQSAMEGDYLRTVPGVHPCDGFFAAVVERQGTGNRE